MTLVLCYCRSDINSDKTFPISFYLSNIYLWIVLVKGGAIVNKTRKRKPNVISRRDVSFPPRYFLMPFPWKQGFFSLTEVTLITRCLKSYKREQSGQKLPANLSYVPGKHEDRDLPLGEDMFNKLILHLMFISKSIMWQKQKSCRQKEKILSKATQATVLETQLNPAGKANAHPSCTIQSHA